MSKVVGRTVGKGPPCVAGASNDRHLFIVASKY